MESQWGRPDPGAFGIAYENQGLEHCRIDVPSGIGYNDFTRELIDNFNFSLQLCYPVKKMTKN